MAVELSTTALIVVIIIVDLLIKRGKRLIWACTLAGAAALLAIAVFSRGEGTFFGGAFVADGLAWLSKLIILMGTVATAAISLHAVRISDKYYGAYSMLLLSASLGMMVLVSSKELITMYVGLETSAVSLFGLAAISKKDELSLEAGIKYVLLGALSSGVLLFGLSLIYASTGTTYLDAIRTSMAARGLSPLFGLGLVFVILGVGFKLSMVPMHVWTPDVYQGAPTPVTAFISVVSKSAGFVFALRLFSGAFLDFKPFWGPVLMVAAALTMTVGNLIAIPQKNVKRLLAYSTISQAGYILVGFVGAPITGMSAVVFYLFVYTLTNLAAFTVVIAFSTITGSDMLDDYAGLARRQPVLGLTFALALLSLAGMPPLGGFVGKIYLFYSAMQQGYLWLVIVAALNSIVSLFYYLLILKRMYILDATREYPKGTVSLPLKAVLLVTMIGIFWLGIMPGTMMNMISEISRKIFASL
jgi:NADH-quinone oxidoreductase subunit N